MPDFPDPLDHGPGLAPAHAVPSPQAISIVQQYDGKTDPNAWLNHVQEVADVYGWNQAQCLKIAKIKLTHAADRWAQARMFNSWQEFEHLLDQRFGETKETAIVRLERCFQRPAESPKTFADRFLQDADRAGRTEDGALVYQFIQRLQADLREEVLRAKPQTIDAVVDTCNYWISARGMIDGGHPDSVTPERASNKPTYKDRPEDYNQPSARRPPFERRYNSTGPGPRAPFRDNHRSNYAPPPPKPAPAMGATAVDDLTKRFQKLEINLSCRPHRQGACTCSLGAGDGCKGGECGA